MTPFQFFVLSKNLHSHQNLHKNIYKHGELGTAQILSLSRRWMDKLQGSLQWVTFVPTTEKTTADVGVKAGSLSEAACVKKAACVWDSPHTWKFKDKATGEKQMSRSKERARPPKVMGELGRTGVNCAKFPTSRFLQACRGYYTTVCVIACLWRLYYACRGYYMHVDVITCMKRLLQACRCYYTPVEVISCL